MSQHRSGIVLIASIVALAVLGLSSPANAQQLVSVHPVAGDPVASGNALLSAVAGITDASATKPYVVKVDPGIFNLGGNSLNMKQYVDIEGTGQLATVIQGTGQTASFTNGVINGAANAELRNFQLQSQASGANYSFAIYVQAANTSIRDVTIVSTGGASTRGIRDDDGNITVQGVTVTASGTTVYGIVVDGVFASPKPYIRRTVVNVSSSGSTGTGYGIYMASAAVPDIRDVEINVTGGGQAVGLSYDYANRNIGQPAGPFVVLLENSRIGVSGASAACYGIQLTGSGNILFVDTSKVYGVGGAGYGLYSTDPTATIYVDRSELSGGTNSLNANSTGVYLGATRLGYPVSAPSPTCAATYRAGTYSLVTSSCVFQ